MAVALLALFIALGGVSYGVATGSIDSREIKNNTVRGKDIRNSTVRSTDVGNRSLLAKDFKAGQLPAGPVGASGATGAEGAKGDPGSPGTPGPPGQDGADGVSGYETVSTGVVSASLSANSAVFRDVECPVGKRAVGGTFDLANTSTTVVENFQVLTSTNQSGNERLWRTLIRNTDDANAHTLTTVTSVICVTATP